MENFATTQADPPKTTAAALEGSVQKGPFFLLGISNLLILPSGATTNRCENFGMIPSFCSASGAVTLHPPPNWQSQKNRPTS